MRVLPAFCLPATAFADRGDLHCGGVVQVAIQRNLATCRPDAALSRSERSQAFPRKTGLPGPSSSRSVWATHKKLGRPEGLSGGCEGRTSRALSTASERRKPNARQFRKSGRILGS